MTVATAHPAVAATASGTESGTAAIATPAGRTMWEAYVPESAHPASVDSWPTLATETHFALRPRRQLRQSPHTAVTAKTTRCPTAWSAVVAAMTPTPSCPSTEGLGAGR
ncbi:Uncharacterised protein [Mycobacteroides abscessus subsp. abscessus]|nr:Uncharacterised protein [Mycobacteroides abscessus subsp. abscessus]